MLKIIYGKRGSGKTKRMIDRANDDIKNTNGDIVFIDKDNHCMLDLNHDIRYINAKEYGEVTQESFLGFICGVMASNYDIEKIYIDGIPGLFDVESLETVLEKVSKLAVKYNVHVMMSISGKKIDMPEFVKAYILED
jgi:hypothetical protein